MNVGKRWGSSSRMLCIITHLDFGEQLLVFASLLPFYCLLSSSLYPAFLESFVALNNKETKILVKQAVSASDSLVKFLHKKLLNFVVLSNALLLFLCSLYRVIVFFLDQI